MAAQQLCVLEIRAPPALGRLIRAPARRCRGRRLTAYDSAVGSSLTVRSARVEDVPQMARVNVDCWRETYRGSRRTQFSMTRASRLLGSGFGLPR